MIRADYKLHNIMLDDIELVEALDDYIKIHLQSGQNIVARMSMKSMGEKLPAQEFKRVHRSYIIPVKNIRSIVNRNIHLGDFIIPIGDAYKDEVAKIITK